MSSKIEFWSWKEIKTLRSSGLINRELKWCAQGHQKFCGGARIRTRFQWLKNKIQKSKFENFKQDCPQNGHPCLVSWVTVPVVERFLPPSISWWIKGSLFFFFFLLESNYSIMEKLICTYISTTLRTWFRKLVGYSYKTFPNDKRKHLWHHHHFHYLRLPCGQAAPCSLSGWLLTFVWQEPQA